VCSRSGVAGSDTGSVVAGDVAAAVVIVGTATLVALSV
jgi:hypothetical protein